MPLGSGLQHLRGLSNETQTTAGSTQATATDMLADHVSVPTVGSGEGIILPAANASDFFTATNADDDNNLLVYPPSGAAFNGKTVNTPLDLPPGAAALFVFTSPTKIMAVFS